jgi:hypothetical protein
MRSLLLSQRLLPVLQLTRMALVFTAIADSQCGLLLMLAHHGQLAEKAWPLGHWKLALAMIGVSVGLYGFGMSLNDIIDRRRDAQIAAGRPLPSGRIGIVTAHVICFLLISLALASGGYYARVSWPHPLLSFALLIVTGLLITFYDFAGKYLVGLGLLSLGLIRFCHALIPAPQIPVPWHPLLLLNHVTILSTVAYAWEQKRPPLTKLHWWGVMGGLALLDAAIVGLITWRRRYEGSVAEALRLQRGLLVPLACVMAFVGLAAWVRATTGTRRAAGQKLMLYGLLWLIVYDASFAAVYVHWLDGAILLLLLPVAYLAVQVMRWWSQMLALSQKPQYRRAQTSGGGIEDGRGGRAGGSAR